MIEKLIAGAAKGVFGIAIDKGFKRKLSELAARDDEVVMITSCDIKKSGGLLVRKGHVAVTRNHILFREKSLIPNDLQVRISQARISVHREGIPLVLNPGFTVQFSSDAHILYVAAGKEFVSAVGAGNIQNIANFPKLLA